MNPRALKLGTCQKRHRIDGARFLLGLSSVRVGIFKVFQTDTNAPGKLIATGRLKAILAAGAAAASLAVMATPASAASIFLDKGEMFTPAQATISAPAAAHYSTVTAWDGPVLFTANYGTVASANTFNFLGFCVDVFDDINVGVNSPSTLNLAYHDGPLVDNGEHGATQAAAFMSLSTTQKTQISALVNFGTNLWNTDTITDSTHMNMSNTLINQLGGIQGAIWQIENPTFTIVGNTSPYGGAGNATAVTTYINTYSSAPFLNTLSTGHIDVVFSDSTNPVHQAFAFATDVPEPSTWAMMIAGFGGVGAMLRRRRKVAAFA